METPERSLVSTQDAACYRVLQDEPRAWLTNREIAQRTRSVMSGLDLTTSERCVRLHTRRFVALGLVDVTRIFPGYRYRPRPRLKPPAVAYARRLNEALTILAEERSRSAPATSPVVQRS